MQRNCHRLPTFAEEGRALEGKSMTKRFWRCALVTFLSPGVSASFALAGLVGGGSG
jgi:hypothetical protein